MRPHPRTFTVPEALRDLGREPYPLKCWWIGSELARRVRARNQLPELPKRLGRKTYRPSGSHDFVQYPDQPLYRALFLEVLIQYEDLFGPGPQPDRERAQPELFAWCPLGVQVDLIL
jgi:hypothetical protein